MRLPVVVGKRLFFTLSAIFTGIGTYLGVRTLTYTIPAHDWSTTGLELFMLPMGLLLGGYFLWKIRRS